MIVKGTHEKIEYSVTCDQFKLIVLLFSHGIMMGVYFMTYLDFLYFTIISGVR